MCQMGRREFLPFRYYSIAFSVPGRNLFSLGYDL